MQLLFNKITMRYITVYILLLFTLSVSGQYVDNSGNIINYFDYGTAIFNSASDKATYTYNDTTYIDTLYDIQNRYHLTNVDSTYITGNDTLNFDGVDDCLVTTDDFELYGGQTRTFSLWFYLTGTGISHLLEYGESSPNKDFRFSVESGGNVAIAIGGNTGISDNLLKGDVIEQNKWYHIVFTMKYKFIKTKIYLNGVDRTIVSSFEDIIINTTKSPLYIGGDIKLDIGRDMKGKIADFRAYDHALSEQEIKALYNNGINDNAVNIIK
jgi:hypothetical protein